MAEEKKVENESSLNIYRRQVKSIKRLNRLATVINALGLAMGLAVMFFSPTIAMVLVISSIFVYAILRDRAGRREENLDLDMHGATTLASFPPGELVKELARQIVQTIPIEQLRLTYPEEVTFEAELTDIRAQGRLRKIDQTGGQPPKT